ncbi:MAG: transglutaminase family protein [Opitutales bacterium]|jgi:transglutaminase-like putative cysteine protease|nr:transglutaminase family protein [Opitutales bacterium]MDP4642877.1 transglutaminase family protein [Opitutales bacterium]MDP4776565.1 transglutaminase family protein [Opitutales bacterium]MDP4879361.1 transglutaminase family protein [Opitutales bacterium]MDP4882726.1 transglutaminase family protein [Opitutales bacterium]
MRFRVSHTTQYKYSQPASESFAELRVWPQSNSSQQVLERRLILKPEVVVDHYVDYYGNNVEFFSVPYRHNSLTVTSVAEVETTKISPSESVLTTSVGEARQIFNSARYQHFEFLQPSSLVPLDQHKRIRKRFFRQAEEIGSALLALNTWIYKSFEYQSGVTNITTPISQIVAERRGVCQDFAHLMLAILRSNGIPSRYVSGYIEAYDPDLVDPEMIGAAASHAWVEVYLPGGMWWGLDPTNNQTAGERHVVVAVGRDYNDVAPMRGTFKGANDQKLNVMVSLERKKEPAAI